MATIITLPKITGLDKELCVPEGNHRLWNYFIVELYSVKHSKIFKPHLFMSTNKFNLPYQKMVDRYQFLTSDGVKPQCGPLCPEGRYFDCETETCKEYSSYNLIPEVVVLTTKSISLAGVVTNLSLAGEYPNYPSIINVPSIGDVALTYSLTLVGNATSSSFSVSKTITSAEEGYLGNAKDAGHNYMSANPWADYWYNSFGTHEYSEVVELTIAITGSVEEVK